MEFSSRSRTSLVWSSRCFSAEPRLRSCERPL